MKAPTTRLPAIAGRVAELADRIVQGLGRYQQQLHVLGEMNHTIACDISATRAELGYDPQRRAVRRDAPQHPLVRRARLGAVMPQRTTSLVTGGSGYFGSLLVRRLVAAGHRVRVLDLNDSDDRPTDVEIVIGDIRDRDVVARAVDGMRHRVQQRRPGAAGEGRTVAAHCQRRRHRTCCCGEAARVGVRKVVHTSSSAVFGVPASNPVLPSTVPSPVEAYGHAKLAAEWACLDAASTGLDVTIVRPRTILGHGRLGIFGILFDWVADGADIFVLGSGDNRYQFVHADDLAEVCLLAAGVAGPAIFNVGTDRFGTMRESLESLCTHAGTGSRVRSLPARPAAVLMKAGAARSPRTVRAVPLDDVLEVAVVRHRPRPRRSRLAAEMVERRDARRQLRLVRQQPRRHRSGAGARTIARSPNRAHCGC